MRFERKYGALCCKAIIITCLCHGEKQPIIIFLCYHYCVDACIHFLQSNHVRELFSLLLLSTLAITLEHQHVSHTEMFYLQYPMKYHTFCPVETNTMLRIDYMPLINPKTTEINQERERDREKTPANNVFITQKQPP